MARLNEKQQKALIAELETGQYSVRELAKKYNVSNATIQKYKEQKVNESEHIVNAGIAYKMGLSKIEEPEKVNAIVTAVDDKTKHLIYFQNSALLNQKKANEMLDSIDNIKDMESHARLTKNNKETVIGRDIDTIINNTNAQQNIDNTLEVKFTKV